MDIKYQLKDKEGNNLFPLTTTDCVVTESGLSLKEKYATKQYADEAAADILNSSPEQLQVINILGEKLADDDNVANAVTEAIANSNLELIIALWNDACKTRYRTFGKYDYENAPDKSKPFFLYKYWYSLEDAIIMLNHVRHLTSFEPRTPTLKKAYEVTLPFKYNLSENHNLQYSFGSSNGNVIAAPKVIIFATNYDYENKTQCMLSVTNLNQAFSNNRVLVEIVGTMDVRWCTDFGSIFGMCQKLEEFDIYGLKRDIDLGPSPYISLNSIDLLVNQAQNTVPITIKVHQDIYDKIVDESNEDWYALNELAIEKQISFITA